MDKIQEYVNLIDKTEEYFEKEYWTDSDENTRMRRGKGWATDEETEIRNQKRIPYNIPVVANKVNLLVSQQMQTPYDIIALPRTQDDEIGAEVKNAIFKYVRDVNDLTYLLSEWFESGMVKKYGVLKRVISTEEEAQGEVLIEKIIPRQFIWDTNCKKFNVARYANFAAEILYMTRDELKSYYPDKADLIDKLSANPTGSTQDQKYQNWYRNEHGTELIKVIKLGQRKYKKQWKTTYNDDTSEMLDNEPEINDTLDKDLAGQGVTFPVEKEETNTEYIEYTIFTKDINEPLDVYTEDSKLLRWHLFFPGFDDGEIFCFIDLLKDPQKFINRYATQIDTSIGKLIKNSYEIDWNNLAPEDKAQWATLSKQLVTGGAVLRRIGQNRIVEPIVSGQIPPELFTAFQFMMQITDDLGGGRNFAGLQESSGESGKAILARQEQGFLAAYLYLYNLGRALKGLGEGIDEDINEIYGNSVERIIDITDNDLDELVKQKFIDMGIYQTGTFRPNRGFLKINKEVAEQFLGQAKTRLIIERGKYQPTERERRLDEWKTIQEWNIQSGQPTLPISIMLDDFGFSPTVKQKIRQHEEEVKQQQQQAQDIQKQKMLFDANLQQQKSLIDANKSLPETQGVKGAVSAD